MQITKLHIYGYGKWIDKTITLSGGVHVLYGQNESGKSTIASFIHSILFGFPQRNASNRRYEPKVASQYGGYIELYHPIFGDVRIERIGKQKSSGEISITCECSEDITLSDVLYDIDLALYRSLYSFDLSIIEEMYGISSRRVQETFIHVSTLGLKTYQDLAHKFEVQAGKLYKEGGRSQIIKQSVSDIKKVSQEVQKAKEANDHYQMRLSEKNKASREWERLAQQKNQAEKKQIAYEHLKKQWPVIEQMRTLEKKIIVAEAQPKVDDIDQRNVLTLQQQIALVDKKIHHKQQDISRLKETYQVSDVYGLYVDNKSSIEALKEMVTKINHMNAIVKDTTEQLHQKKQKLSDYIKYERITMGEAELLDVWSDQEDDRLNQWQQDSKICQQTIQNISYQYDTLRHQIQRVTEKTEQFEIDNANPLTKQRFIYMVGIIISILIVWQFKISWLGIVVLIGILGSIVVAMEWVRYRTDSTVKEQHQQALHQLDGLCQQHKHLKAELDRQKHQKEMIDQAFIHFKQRYHIPNHVTLVYIREKKPIYTEIVRLSHEIKDLDDRLRHYKETWHKQKEFIDNLCRQLPAHIFERTAQLQDIEKIFRQIDREKKYMNQFELQQDRLISAIDELEHEKRIMIDKQTEIYERYHVKTSKEMDTLIEHTRQYDLDRSYYKQLFAQYGDEVSHIATLTELNNHIQTLTDDINTLTQQKNKIMEQQSERHHDLKQLEEGAHYATQVQLLEDKKSQLADSVEQWVVNCIAQQLILETLAQLFKHQLPSVIQEASDYFKRLTNGVYQSVLLDEDQIAVKTTNNQVFWTHELSRGTIESLYIALRLAFINHQAQSMPLPIIMDDVCVNLDFERRRVMYDIIKEIAQNTQVIMLTFDRFILEKLTDQQLTKL